MRTTASFGSLCITALSGQHIPIVGQRIDLESDVLRSAEGKLRSRDGRVTPEVLEGCERMVSDTFAKGVYVVGQGGPGVQKCLEELYEHAGHGNG